MIIHQVLWAKDGHLIPSSANHYRVGKFGSLEFSTEERVLQSRYWLRVLRRSVCADVVGRWDLGELLDCLLEFDGVKGVHSLPGCGSSREQNLSRSKSGY